MWSFCVFTLLAASKNRLYDACMLWACLSFASAGKHNWPNRVFMGEFRECADSCNCSLTSKMDFMILDGITEDVKFPFRGEIKRNLVAVFPTYAQEFVARVIPPNVLFDSKLIEH